MTMYMSYNRDGHDALMKGNHTFSEGHGNWQTRDHYNSTLDGAKTYELTKKVGQTLASHLSAIQRGIDDSNVISGEMLSAAEQRVDASPSKHPPLKA